MSLDRDQKIRIGEWFFRYRDYTPIPLIVLLLIMGDPSVLSATLGILTIMLGELFRIYSVSFIGTVSRTRSDSTGQKLVIQGPFAYVRNPLYVGNLFVSMGFAVFSANFWLMLLTFVMFAVQYYFIVRYEESILVQKFGEDYEKYKQKVPAWIPSDFPKLEEIEWPREFSSALKSEKRTLTTIFALLAIIIALA